MTPEPWLLAVLLLTAHPMVLRPTVEFPTVYDCRVAAALVRFDAPGLGLNLMVQCYQKGSPPPSHIDQFWPMHLRRLPGSPPAGSAPPPSADR